MLLLIQVDSPLLQKRLLLYKKTTPPSLETAVGAETVKAIEQLQRLSDNDVLGQLFSIPLPTLVGLGSTHLPTWRPPSTTTLHAFG